MPAIETVARYRWVILLAAVLSQVAANLSVTAVGALAPLFQEELGLTKTQVGLFTSAAFAGSWCVVLVAGALTDRFGVRRVLFLAQVVMGLALGAVALVGSYLQALAALLVAGAGSGTSLPPSSRAIMDWFPTRTRATVMGIKQAGGPMGGVLAGMLLPAVGLAVGWRSAIGLVGLWVLSAGVLILFLYRNAARHESKRGEGVGVGGALGQLLRSPRIWLLSVISLLFMTGQATVMAYTALYFSDAVLVATIPDQSARVVAAGGYLALSQGGGVAGRVVWGVVSDRLFRGRRMAVLAIVGVLSVLLSVVVSDLDSGYPAWFLASVCFAYGATAVGWNGLYYALTVETAGRQYSGTGVGLVTTVVQLGTIFGPPLFGFIVDQTGSYRPAWLFLGGLCALGTLMAAAAARGEKRAV